MSILIRSISGIRGIVGNGLTPEVVVKYSAAYAKYCSYGPIIVGYDGRPSGLVMKKLVCGTLQSCGVQVTDLGMAPTPTVQMKVENTGAAGGISITASHNPSEWNGLKFLDSSGIFLDAEQNAELFRIADEMQPEYRIWDAIGDTVNDDDYIYQHIDAALSIPFIDIHGIRSRKFRIALDAVNASASIAAEELLNNLNCEVIPVACDGSGIFPHTPEPLPENLVSLGEAVRQHHADMGFAIDPDGDRLVMFTESGEPFGEEYTITTAVDAALSSLPPAKRGPVVVNLSTTRAVEDVAGKAGVVFERTPVGEINVVKRMKEIGALIGGEGSGGVILPFVHAGRDSLVGMALVLHAFATFDGSVGAYKAMLPQYVIRKFKYSLNGIDSGEAFRRVLDAFSGERIDTRDGVRIDFSEGWVHLRTSNTEPIMRAIAEAATEEAATELANRVTERAFG